MEEKIFLDKPKYTWAVTTLILYSVLCFSLETLPNLNPPIKTFLYYSEIVIVLLFTIEYIARVFCSKKRLHFIFSFYGMIDLLAILPFYLTFFIDLRSLRLARLFRLIRILKLTRYSSALQRFVKALYMAREELIIFSIASLIVLYLSAVGIYHFEHTAQPDVFRSIFDALWWAMATLTTVGYGDVYPITNGGRFFTFIVLVIGLGFVAVPTGIVASALSSLRPKSDQTET